MKTKRIAIIVFLSMFMASVNIASAYTIKYRYGFDSVPAYVQGSNTFSEDTTTAIHNACLAWNMVHDGDLVYRDTVKHSTSTYPILNSINQITKGTRGTNSYLLETAFISTGSNRVYEADIDINVSFPFGTASTSYDIQTCLTHELGHLLGLDESNVEGAVMYPHIEPGVVRGVAQDDVNGINAIY